MDKEPFLVLLDEPDAKEQQTFDRVLFLKAVLYELLACLLLFLAPSAPVLSYFAMGLRFVGWIPTLCLLTGKNKSLGFICLSIFLLSFCIWDEPIHLSVYATINLFFLAVAALVGIFGGLMLMLSVEETLKEQRQKAAARHALPEGSGWREVFTALRSTRELREQLAREEGEQMHQWRQTEEGKKHRKWDLRVAGGLVLAWLAVMLYYTLIRAYFFGG